MGVRTTRHKNTQGKPDPTKNDAQYQTPFESLRIESPDADQTSTTLAKSCAAADGGSRGLRCLLDQLFLRWATNQIAARLAAKDLCRKALHRTRQDYCKLGGVGKHYFEKFIQADPFYIRTPTNLWSPFPPVERNSRAEAARHATL